MSARGRTTAAVNNDDPNDQWSPVRVADNRSSLSMISDVQSAVAQIEQRLAQSSDDLPSRSGSVATSSSLLAQHLAPELLTSASSETLETSTVSEKVLKFEAEGLFSRQKIDQSTSVFATPPPPPSVSTLDSFQESGYATSSLTTSDEYFASNSNPGPLLTNPTTEARINIGTEKNIQELPEGNTVQLPEANKTPARMGYQHAQRQPHGVSAASGKAELSPEISQDLNPLEGDTRRLSISKRDERFDSLPNTASAKAASVEASVEASPKNAAGVAKSRNRTTANGTSSENKLGGKSISIDAVVERFETPSKADLPKSQRIEIETTPIAATVQQFEAQQDIDESSSQTINIDIAPIAPTVKQFEAPQQDEPVDSERTEINAPRIAPTVAQFEAPKESPSTISKDVAISAVPAVPTAAKFEATAELDNTASDIPTSQRPRESEQPCVPQTQDVKTDALTTAVAPNQSSGVLARPGKSSSEANASTPPPAVIAANLDTEPSIDIEKTELMLAESTSVKSTLQYFEDVSHQKGRNCEEVPGDSKPRVLSSAVTGDSVADLKPTQHMIVGMGAAQVRHAVPCVSDNEQETGSSKGVADESADASGHFKNSQATGLSGSLTVQVQGTPVDKPAHYRPASVENTVRRVAEVDRTELSTWPLAISDEEGDLSAKKAIDASTQAKQTDPRTVTTSEQAEGNVVVPQDLLTHAGPSPLSHCTEQIDAFTQPGQELKQNSEEVDQDATACSVKAQSANPRITQPNGEQEQSETKVTAFVPNVEQMRARLDFHERLYPSAVIDLASSTSTPTAPSSTGRLEGGTKHVPQEERRSNIPSVPQAGNTDSNRGSLTAAISISEDSAVHLVKKPPFGEKRRVLPGSASSIADVGDGSHDSEALSGVPSRSSKPGSQNIEYRDEENSEIATKPKRGDAKNAGSSKARVQSGASKHGDTAEMNISKESTSEQGDFASTERVEADGNVSSLDHKQKSDPPARSDEGSAATVAVRCPDKISAVPATDSEPVRETSSLPLSRTTTVVKTAAKEDLVAQEKVNFGRTLSTGRKQRNILDRNLKQLGNAIYEAPDHQKSARVGITSISQRELGPAREPTRLNEGERSADCDRGSGKENGVETLQRNMTAPASTTSSSIPSAVLRKEKGVTTSKSESKPECAPVTLKDGRSHSRSSIAAPLPENHVLQASKSQRDQEMLPKKEQARTTPLLPHGEAKGMVGEERSTPIDVLPGSSRSVSTTVLLEEPRVVPASAEETTPKRSAVPAQNLTGSELPSNARNAGAISADDSGSVRKCSFASGVVEGSASNSEEPERNRNASVKEVASGSDGPASPAIHDDKKFNFEAALDSPIISACEVAEIAEMEIDVDDPSIVDDDALLEEAEKLVAELETSQSARLAPGPSLITANTGQLSAPGELNASGSFVKLGLVKGATAEKPLKESASVPKAEKVVAGKNSTPLEQSAVSRLGTSKKPQSSMHPEGNARLGHLPSASGKQSAAATRVRQGARKLSSFFSSGPDQVQAEVRESSATPQTTAPHSRVQTREKERHHSWRMERDTSTDVSGDCDHKTPVAATDSAKAIATSKQKESARPNTMFMQVFGRGNRSRSTARQPEKGQKRDDMLSSRILPPNMYDSPGSPITPEKKGMAAVGRTRSARIGVTEPQRLSITDQQSQQHSSPPLTSPQAPMKTRMSRPKNAVSPVPAGGGSGAADNATAMRDRATAPLGGSMAAPSVYGPSPEARSGRSGRVSQGATSRGVSPHAERRKSVDRQSLERSFSRLPRVAHLTGNEGREKAAAQAASENTANGKSTTPARLRLRRGSTFSGVLPKVKTSGSTPVKKSPVVPTSPTTPQSSNMDRPSPALGSKPGVSLGENVGDRASPALGSKPRVSLGDNAGDRATATLSNSSNTSRPPLRRTLSFSHGRRTATSPGPMAVSQPASPAGIGMGRPDELGSVSSGRLGRKSTFTMPRPPSMRIPKHKPTVPEPFRLTGLELHEKSQQQIELARRRADELERRRRAFRPRPMPDFSHPSPRPFR